MIHIRKATREDAQAAWDVRKHAVLARCSSVYPEDQIIAWTSGSPGEKWADMVEGRFHVAVDGDAVVATGMLTEETGKIDAIFVLPFHMGRGIGMHMMLFLENLALEYGLSALTLESSLNAAPFYRRCGFSGDTVAKYHSPRGISMDCVPMVKSLLR
ncbi:MAG TPA: GNAT family N-acetyltransferase [Paraburkholderia sp.]|jgi:GNAT superfamily N-acetyltransferase